jgi:ribosomal protein L9
VSSLLGCPYNQNFSIERGKAQGIIKRASKRAKEQKSKRANEQMSQRAGRGFEYGKTGNGL